MYAYASKGVKVDWVIRGKVVDNVRFMLASLICVFPESGHGAAWMAPPYVTPLKKWLEKLVRKYAHIGGHDSLLNMNDRHAHAHLV
jgi:hypothetical protein